MQDAPYKILFPQRKTTLTQPLINFFYEVKGKMFERLSLSLFSVLCNSKIEYNIRIMRSFAKLKFGKMPSRVFFRLSLVKRPEGQKFLKRIFELPSRAKNYSSLSSNF